ncbi:EAL domain-containing protein [Colwellia sp. MEBiC06753]
MSAKSSAVIRYSVICSFILLFVLVAANISNHLSTQNTQSFDFDKAPISLNSSYLIDNNSLLTVEQVVGQLPNFIEEKPSDIPFKLGAESYWLLFTLTNSSDLDAALMLHIDNTMLSDLEVFAVANEAIMPINQASLHDTAFPYLSIKLPQFSQQQLLLKLKAGGPPTIPLQWYEAEQLQTREALTRLLFGAVIGIFAIMAIYNLIIFAAIKDKVYAIYLGYLISTFLVLATVNGFGYLIFSAELQQVLQHYSLLFHYSLLLFLLLFTTYFLQHEQDNRWPYKLSIGFAGLLVLLAIVTRFVPHALQAQIFFSLPPLYYALSLLLMMLKMRKQLSWARFYFLSWIPLLLGAAVQPLAMFNYLQYSFITHNAFLIAVAIEIVFMAFALAERMRMHEKIRLQEISYHPDTGIVRKIIIENHIDKLIRRKKAKFSVLVIKPEHIDRVGLYISSKMKNELYKRIYKKLSSLFVYNDAVEIIGDRGEKIALVNGNALSIIINHRHNHQPMATIVQSINTLIEEAYIVDNLQLPLGAMVGIANFPEHGDAAFELLNKAQQALLIAESSPGKWAYIELQQSEQTSYRLQLAADINQAINQGQFELYHQPQIDLKTMRVCGSECLIRWQHPVEGNISPLEFIAIAEDMGLINRLTQWVVTQAFAQQSVLAAHGYKNHLVSINISGKDLIAEGFYEFIAESLANAELLANKVVLELTESASIIDNDYAANVISQLTDLGITISIDDFGTGYSSLAYIDKLPFQELKVDRQFVENVCGDKKRKIIAEATVTMAKGLGLEVVAEGINSQEDEDTLRQFGCDIGQGYYYAKPMAFDDYLEWLGGEINGRSPPPLEGDFIPKSATLKK